MLKIKNWNFISIILNVKISLLLILAFLVSSYSLNAQEFRSSTESPSATASLPSRFVFSPSFLFRVDHKRQESKTEFDWSLMDFRFGYQSSDRWYAGVLFSYDRESISANNYPVSGLETIYEYVRTHYAISGGYNWKGFYGILNLVFLGEWTARENGVEKKFSNGWGFQLDLGIHFALFEQFFIGPRFTYRDLSYSQVKDSNGSQSISPSLRKVNFDPYFVLWLEF